MGSWRQLVGQRPIVDADGWVLTWSSSTILLWLPWGCQRTFIHLSRLVSTQLSWQEGCYLPRHFPCLTMGIGWCVFIAFTTLVALFDVCDVVVAFC